MPLYYLEEEELDSLVKNEIYMIGDKVGIISYDMFKPYFIKYTNGEITDEETIVKLFLEGIEVMNGNISETIVPHFGELEDYENIIEQDFNLNDFDSDFNYLGDASPVPLKKIVGTNIRKIFVSGDIGEYARKFDYTIILKHNIRK